MHNKDKKRSQRRITRLLGQWLLLCVCIALLCTWLFVYCLQNWLSDRETQTLLSINISDVTADISDASDENLLALTHTVANLLEAGETDLDAIAEEYSIAEINVVNGDGVITASTYASFLGYQMADGAQSGEFCVLLGDAEEYVQSYQPISYDESISRKYAGVSLSDGGFVQVGYDAEEFQKDIDAQVIGATRNRHVGQSGYILISDESGVIVSDRNGGEGQALSVTGITLDTDDLQAGEKFRAEVYGESCFCMYDETEGYYIISVLPASEALASRNTAVVTTVAAELIVFACEFLLICFLMWQLVVKNIYKINDSLSEITAGHLDVKVDVCTNREFTALSQDINATVDTLKRYIAETAARMDQELAYAKEIQYASLPGIFPPYTDCVQFDLFASMHTAREVGGDFYDFYFAGEDRLAFLVADVSGKGIPAAMFMMRAKTLIKGLAESGMEVNEVFTRANTRLCENNEANMFVTAWLGVLHLKTGLVEYVNAGHNPPLVNCAEPQPAGCRDGKDPGFHYLKSRPGFVLAGMEGIRYRKNVLQLSPGDTVFLYTDGVTEATDGQMRLYGEERLRAVVNSSRMTPEELCAAVKADVDAFVGGAPQFDDITMLALTYKGDGAEAHGKPEGAAGAL
ncbi:MAG: SpoIIE family protein phosphatase [Clostridiales bacterium]|nr:SpoIIE family protein phosphatase [Clostridiales bacterium]